MSQLNRFALIFAVMLGSLVGQSPGVRWEVDTFAGAGPSAEGAALGAFLSSPSRPAVDSEGNLYFSDPTLSWIRKITPGGAISVLAGTGEPGASVDGTSAVEAQFSNPGDVAVGPNGSVLVVETSSARIRLIAQDGNITTVAGTGSFGTGQTANGEPATEFPLGFVSSLSYDPLTDSTYIGQFGQILRISDGEITTIAGDGMSGFAGDGGPARQAKLGTPSSLSYGPDGSIYFIDNARIRKIAPNGTITTFAGNGQGGDRVPDGVDADEAGLGFFRGLAVDPQGFVYFGDPWGDIRRVEANGTLSTFFAAPPDVILGHMTFGTDGDLYAVEQFRSVIQKITPVSSPDGSVSSTATIIAGGSNLLGDGGPALAARLHRPGGLAFDPAGNLVFADALNAAIRRISAEGTVSRVAGTGKRLTEALSENVFALQTPIGTPSLLETDGGGNILFGMSPLIRLVTADGRLRTVPGFRPTDNRLLSSIHVDAQGAIFFSDSRNNTVHKRTGSGAIEAVAGNGTFGFSGDGGPATEASLGFVGSLTTDAAGSLYLASTSNGRIRKVSASDGTIMTVAGNGSFFLPESLEDGVAADVVIIPQAMEVGPQGDIFFVDRAAIRRLYMPTTAATSAKGVLQGIGSGAQIETIAGDGTLGFRGDGGNALVARFNFPAGLAAGPDGKLYVSDTNNQRIRVLSPTTSPLIVPGGVRNGASFVAELVAPGTITSIFGLLLGTGSEAAIEIPLPTELAETTVQVVDSEGTVHDAQLLFVGGKQINMIFPENAALGAATLTVSRPNAESHSIEVEVASIAPGIFSLNASGTGVGAIQGIRVDAAGGRSDVEVFRFDTTLAQWVPVPIDLGPEGDEVFLSLWGTGIRGFSDISALSATVAGEAVPVLAAAPNQQFVGVDQVAIGPLPRSLTGSSVVDIQLTVDDIGANVVTVNIL